MMRIQFKVPNPDGERYADNADVTSIIGKNVLREGKPIGVVIGYQIVEGMLLAECAISDYRSIIDFTQNKLNNAKAELSLGE